MSDQLLNLSRPECDYVFLRGYGEEAVGQYLRGKVTLSVREGESVKGVQLRLSRQISLWYVPTKYVTLRVKANML